MRILRLILFVELVLLAVWVVWSVQNGWTRPDSDLLLSIQAYGSVGGPSVPNEEIEPYFDRARNRMVAANSVGNTWNTISLIASWLAFLLATVTTGVAAYYGRQEPPAGLNPVDSVQFLRGRAGRNAWLVGLLAAGIAVTTAVGNRAAADAAQRYKRADEILLSIRQTRVSLADEKLTRAQVFDLLEDMELRAQR